jgi:hypothetical protein
VGSANAADAHSYTAHSYTAHSYTAYPGISGVSLEPACGLMWPRPVCASSLTFG